jgi:hypothetical protein
LLLLITDRQKHAFARGLACARLLLAVCKLRRFDVSERGFGYRSIAATVRNFPLRIYCVVTLFTGYVFFDEIGMLQAHEFDGEAIFDVPDDAPLRLADGHHDADWRSQFCRDSDGSA